MHVPQLLYKLCCQHTVQKILLAQDVDSAQQIRIASHCGKGEPAAPSGKDVRCCCRVCLSSVACHAACHDEPASLTRWQSRGGPCEPASNEDNAIDSVRVHALRTMRFADQRSGFPAGDSQDVSNGSVTGLPSPTCHLNRFNRRRQARSAGSPCWRGRSGTRGRGCICGRLQPRCAATGTHDLALRLWTQETPPRSWLHQLQRLQPTAAKRGARVHRWVVSTVSLS